MEHGFCFYSGRGKIKKFSFILLLIYLFSFFNLFPQDSTGDLTKTDIAQDDYIKKVRSTIIEPDRTGDNREDEIKGDESFSLNTWGYSLRIIFTLIVIIGAIYVIFNFMKKRLKINNSLGDEASVLSSQSLGPGRWIQVVYVGGKYLILGITNDNINLLTEITDEKEIERLEILNNERKVEAGESFSDIFSKYFKVGQKREDVVRDFDYEKDSVDFLKEQRERLNNIKDDDKE